MSHHPTFVLLVGLACAFALAGCIKNPDAPSPETGRSVPVSSPANPGEPSARRPVTPAAQSPTSLQATPAAALAAFASLYVNWSYSTLTKNQRTLASMSVGAARLTEQQAAASSTADTTITRGRVWNHGQIISIAPARSQPGTWVLVTREQTGGSSSYQGLPATYHVTLAHLAHIPAGYAVSEWLPQT